MISFLSLINTGLSQKHAYSCSWASILLRVRGSISSLYGNARLQERQHKKYSSGNVASASESNVLDLQTDAVN